MNLDDMYGQAAVTDAHRRNAERLEREAAKIHPVWEQAEVRHTSATGGQKGVKPQRLELLPPGALLQVAEVYHYGATKYADHNWRRGYNWSWSLGALLRHVMLFMGGEDRDKESGLPHLAHAVFHCLTLLTFGEHAKYKQFDDRYNEEEE